MGYLESLEERLRVTGCICAADSFTLSIIKATTTISKSRSSRWCSHAKIFFYNKGVFCGVIEENFEGNFQQIV